MEKDTSIQVIFITGNGHSGSTLLDIILGSLEGCFSAGELTNITRETIMEEYCSCNTQIPECEVWSEIIKSWEAKREISYQRYQQLRWHYERNKRTLHALFSFYRPSADFRDYCLATLHLLQAIRDVTGQSVIIDSSKSPQRIAVLSKIVDLQVIHLCRDFTGVINSSKGFATKNIKAGIEEDNPPRKTWKVVRDWIATNMVAEIFCGREDSQKVFYKNFVQQPESLRNIHPLFATLNGDDTFKPNHILAGNALRLKESLKINPRVGFEYKRLTPRQLKFARWIDQLFPFWSGINT
ncbi:hypothetical protein ACG2F4_18630 [Halalkalibaculum sp. DA3122]|uniref:hypothetical protein n=1 Tax=unclassified Halalkalibaculum TaxID=2964617 RepID=UPI0037547B7B